MEAFQQSLNTLRKESNELITQCQSAMVAAVERGNITPSRIAITLAQRFTEERIATSFPVLSLIDCMLSHLAKTPPSAGQPTSVALAAVLGEFWKLAPGLFVFYATVPDAGLKDKTLKRLRRWKQRNLLTEPTVGKLIAAVEEGPGKGGDDEGEEAREEGEGKADEAEEGAGRKQPQQHSERGRFTHAQARAFAAVLRRCTSMLEQLPTARSRPYLELIEREHFTHPTAAAFAFFQDLLWELQQRERHGGSASSPSAAGKGGDEREGGGGAEREGGAGSNRAALSRLLDKLSANSGDDAGRDAGGAPGGSAVIKYTSPLFSDVHLRQSLAQRPGFAVLAKRRLPSVVGGGGSAGGDMYYPKREAKTQRPFRVPLSITQEGPAVRTWFPTPQVWLSIEDSADAPTFASRADAQLADGGWHGGGGGGRKRPRD